MAIIIVMAVIIAIVKYCPNLKSVYTIFGYYEVKTLEAILKSCQQLESIETWCGHALFGDYLNENKLLEMVVKYSPKTFYGLKMHFECDTELFSEELESVFISWEDRKSQKPLSLNIISINDLNVKKESMEEIEKFKKLGVIKEFEIVKKKQLY